VFGVDFEVFDLVSTLEHRLKMIVVLVVEEHSVSEGFSLMFASALLILSDIG
jgi:capsular polysaccharide biosynthesis protein